MSCILRISGTDLFIDELLKIELVPDTTWQKGSPKIASKPDSKKCTNSGARYLVSDADFNEFDIQKTEAIEFLKKIKNNLKR